MAEVASQTIDLVGREVSATLAEARGALEGYVEQPDNSQLLETCAQQLHQVQGVLRLLEIYGAALLAEEMEHVAQYLLATHAERKSQAESLDALMRAMVQLPSYLERVLAGGRDLALVLLPLLNDLRAVRGNALLSEGTLLLLNLRSDQQRHPQAASPGEPALTVEQWARRVRARYQMGLIGWIRGERSEQNLQTLAAVAAKLEQMATRQPVFQLWWVIGAVIEALQESGLESGQSVKRLLGLGDREIRRLYEQGEARYSQSPPVELLNNLLYYVGRAECAGPRVSAVRTSFRLRELLPVDESIEQERENLSAPSVKLMQTVAAAIREDLSKVKDVLDIFVRRGAAQPQELSPQVELLRKIGDTLGVLGLGELRASVQSETERLRKIVEGTLKADESTLVEIAAALIGVEDKLDDSLVGMILPKDAQLPRAAEDTEFQQVQAAVLRECIVNLARIKDAITQSVGGTLDAAGLDSWPDLMRGLKAGLLLLGKARAVEVIEAITVQLKRVMQPGIHVLPPGYIDRLADAIVSVEYYMETLQAGRSDPWYMLDNAQACVQALEQQPTPGVPTVEPLESAALARTVQIPSLSPPPGRRPDAEAVDAAAPTLAPSKRGAAPAEPADPELMKLFIEEAQEELARIQHFFSVWDQNPLERDALITVRRSFHTLKGRGRMDGARERSESAWAIENLMNPVLDTTVTRTPAILETLRAGVAALPEVITQLQTREAPRTDVTAISTRAHALAAGGRVSAPGASDQGDEEATAETQTGLGAVAGPATAAARRSAPAKAAPAARPAARAGAAPAAQAPARQAPPDDTLRDIYARETAAHVATVRGYLERESQLPEPHPLPEDVYRACHTLSGSSKMAQARHGIRLAEPLDRWLRRAFNSGLGLTDGALTLLSDCMGAMESDASHELETLVMAVDNGTIGAEPAVFDLIQASLDELARMREQVVNGRPVAPPRAMIASLQDLSRSDGATPAEPPPVPPPDAAPARGAVAAAAPAAPAAAESARSDSFGEPDTMLRRLNAELVQMAQPQGRPVHVEPAAGADETSIETAPSSAPGSAEAASGTVSAAAALIRPRTAEPHAEEGLLPPQPVPPGREPGAGGERQEMARVDAELLDQLLNISGEASIARARLEQQLGSFDFNLGELSRTVTRLKEQLRSLEIETEAQILHKHDDEGPQHRSQFDPLELDRYSSIQQYSRALAETANDVASIQQLLESLAKETQTLLQQQARTITELQNGLMRTRMVPFQRHVQRLARIVRQAAADTGKRAELTIEGASGELDRQVLERMLPPFEHMLRNAVVHGIEKPEERVRRGKAETGRILLELHREGAEVMVRLTDDGGGMNLKAIREKAEALGLIASGQTLSDEDAMQLVLEPGFSTAGAITQQAGRGVGMDVVATEIKRLGGALHMETKAGEGTVFTIRLPLTLAISHALVVRVDEEYYALPLPTVEGVLRLSKSVVTSHLGRDAPAFDYGGQKYRFQHLASFVGLPPSELPGQDVTIPVVLVRAGEHSTGLVTDELIGSREIVVKSVGPQISSIRGISGATILGDGRIVIILDIGALVRAEWRARAQAPVAPRERVGDRRIFAMVVDDSITVRRVTQRLLERNGMRVLTARDGMDAVALLQDHVPDVILLDIEMPRMDGYEVAAHVRNDPRLKDVPIIMVTSRVGDKHRARAIELGVDDYLGKPYQEAQLLDAIAPLVAKRRAAASGQAYAGAAGG